MAEVSAAADRGAARRAANLSNPDDRFAKLVGLTRSERRTLARRRFTCQCGNRVKRANYNAHLRKCEPLRVFHNRTAAHLAKRLSEADQGDEKADEPGS